MRLRLTLFAQTSHSLSLLEVSEEGRERGGMGREKWTKRKKAAPIGAARMNGSTFSLIHSEGLVQGCARTLPLSLFSSFFLLLGKLQKTSGSRLFWSDLRRRRPWVRKSQFFEKCSISLSWRVLKHPSRTVSVPAASLPSLSVTSGLAPFSSTSAFVTLAFFTSLFFPFVSFSFCSVLSCSFLPV